jgi:hypothetical protein
MYVTKPFDNDIVVIKEFISNDQAQELVQFAESLSEEDWSLMDLQSGMNSPSFKNKNYALAIEKFPVCQEVTERAIRVLSELYDLEEELYLTGFYTLSRVFKEGMGSHHDGGDGLANVTKYGFVLYLNTCGKDFDGGELYYSHKGIVYTPAACDLVIHPGTLEYSHGVYDVSRGARYTLTSFAKTVNPHTEPEYR